MAPATTPANFFRAVVQHTQQLVFPFVVPAFDRVLWVFYPVPVGIVEQGHFVPFVLYLLYIS